MDIDYNRLTIKDGEDNIYENYKKKNPGAGEEELKNMVLNSLSDTFSKYYMQQGDDAEISRRHY